MRRARAAVDDLLAAYETLAARYALLCASVDTAPLPQPGTDAHSLRLLLQEIKDHHRPNIDGEHCVICLEFYPCHTVALIEGKA